MILWILALAAALAAGFYLGTLWATHVFFRAFRGDPRDAPIRSAMRSFGWIRVIAVGACQCEKCCIARQDRANAAEALAQTAARN